MKADHTAPRIRALVEEAQPLVQKLAKRVAGRQTERIDELTQIGIAVLCERAPSHAEESFDRFMQLNYHRVYGAMLDTARAERRERVIRRALTGGVDSVSVHVDEGNYFDPETERMEHRRRAAAAVVAATLFSLLREREGETPEKALELEEERFRVRTALQEASASLPIDDWEMVQDVFVRGETYVAAGARRNLTESAAWKRVESALDVLHRRIRVQLA